MKMKITAILIFCAAAVLPGCANVQEGVSSLVAPGAKKVAEISSSLSPEQAAAARAAYYAETERVLVGWSPGDDGYDEAVQKYITEPAEVQNAYWSSITTGSYDILIRKLQERGASFDNIKKDGRCFVLNNGWRSCPPPE